MRLFGVALLQALQEQLNPAVGVLPRHALTQRDIRLPKISNKAHAVIWMRRAGKTCCLRVFGQTPVQGNPLVTP